MAGDALSVLIKDYPAGTILFEENDCGSRMFVIRGGRVRIFRRFGGAEIVLAFLGAGDFFGEMALLENLPRSASAEVVEAAQLIEVDGNTFEEMIRGNTEIAVRIMRKLASRLRESDRRLDHLLIESAIGRALEVLRWLEPQGVGEGEWTRLVGAGEHVDIAAQAGLPSTQAPAVIAQLERAGCLRKEGSDLLIARRKHLDEYVSYLDMKRKYDPETQIPSEAGNLRQEERLRAMHALLTALKITPEAVSVRQQALADNYRRYFELRKRFKSFEDADA